MAEEKPIAPNRRAGLVGPRPPADTVLSPKEIVGILRRHVLLIVALTVAGIVVGGLACAGLRRYLPKYTARTYIEVLPPVQTDPMAIITPLVSRDIRYGHRLSVAQHMKQQITLQDLLARDVVTGTDWYDRADTLEKRVRYLTKHLGAYAHRDADYIEVSMTCRDPDEAKDIVNEMVAMFISSQGLTKQQEVLLKKAELEKQRVIVERGLHDAENSLDEIRRISEMSGLERSIGRYFKNTVTLILDQLELAKNDLELAIKQFEADIKVLEELAQEGPLPVQIEHMIELDPIMVALAQQIAFTDARIESMLTKFGENHREVRQMQEYREEIKAGRDARADAIGEQTRNANLENAVDRVVILKERYDELERMRAEAEAKQRDLDNDLVQYQRGAKIRDERVAMLDEIKKQMEKLNIIAGDPETPKVRALGAALKPLRMPFSRQWWVWFPGGTVLGFLLSIGLAFLIELADDKVRTPRDVSKYLHIPLLGVVPDASEDRQVRGIDLCRVVSQAPYSILSESYRQCRTNLKLSGTGESVKVLLVTSGSPGDGKTSVAVNLATAFVAEDKKVLLIDANFRQPTSERLFPKGQTGDLDEGGLSVGFGLSGLLVGQCGTQEAIRSSGIEGLDIIDAGLLPPNPAELLGSVRMDELLKEQRNNYDYVIIDSPPVLLISDAKVLAKLADATVLVFNALATRRGAAQRTIREMQNVDANVVGCVLLGAPVLKGGYFQEQFKSYTRYQEKLQLAGPSM